MSRLRLLLRCFVSVAMVLDLLAGEGLHELAHSRGLAADSSATSGRVEVHSSDCPHHPHAPAQHDHGCLLCQHGLDLHALNSPECPVRTALPRHRPLADHQPETAGEVLVPGALGARAPPLMSV